LKPRLNSTTAPAVMVSTPTVTLALVLPMASKSPFIARKLLRPRTVMPGVAGTSSSSSNWVGFQVEPVR
jgi:hypothetical protein